LVALASGMLIPQPIALLPTCGPHAITSTEQLSPRKLLEKWFLLARPGRCCRGQ
jgi:hypothetical protein